MAKQLINEVVQVDEKNQIHVRENEWRGEVKMYIQGFFTPGANDQRGRNADGYSFGKAVTFPPEKLREIHAAIGRALAQLEARNGTGKSTKKQRRAEREAEERDVETLENDII